MDIENKIMDLLEGSGYDVYLVGGCVRDNLLGLDSLDNDLVTDAPIDEMIRIFRSSGKFGYVDEVGKNFGVVIVDGVEVAQYRTEEYVDSIKPSVTLGATLLSDSERRDFTINAMYEDRDGFLVDPQNGRLDLDNLLIRAVGSAERRFKEDPSRILRGIYLAAKLGFQIEDETARVMSESMYLMDLIPHELKGKIIKKSIDSGTFGSFLEILSELGLVGGLFPELAHTVGMDQNPKYHKYDVWTHTLYVVYRAESLRKGDLSFLLGALYHDVAKGLDGVRGVNKDGKPNDLGHEEVGAPIAYDSVLRFGFGKVVAEDVSFLVKNHGLRLGDPVKDSTLYRKIHETKDMFSDRDDLTYSWNMLMDLMECDALSFADDFSEEMVDHVNRVWDRMDVMFYDERHSRMFYVNELPVTGRDLIELGYRGKEIGEVLEKLVYENVSNRDRAIDLLSRWIG